MIPKSILSVFIILVVFQVFGQEFLYVEHFDATSSTSYIDNHPYEDYDFAIPVNANILEVPGDRVNTGSKGDYFYSVYGPRPLSDYDFHLGEDITARVRDGSTEYDDSSPPPIISMCDGTIVYMDNTFSDKGSIEVRCDGILFDPADNDGWGEVYIAYRHMEAHSSGLSVGSEVDKGEILGTVGSTGASSHHLHLSMMRCVDDCETSDPDYENVNPLRLFQPANMPHLLSKFTREGIFVQLLETTSTTATFRAIFLPEQVAIHSFEITYNGSNHASFIFEEINLTGDRDNPCVMPNICVFPNAFNRYKSAFERYEDRQDDYYYDHDNNGATAEVGFPSLTFPIEDDYPFNIPTYVLDIVVSNLSTGFDPSLLELEVRDIYGSGLRVNAADKYIYSEASGNWSTPSIWSGGTVPTNNDKVIINHDVDLSTNASVKTITISSTATTNASLNISSGASVTIDENLLLIGDNDGQNTKLFVVDDASSLTVGESLLMKRYYDADSVFLKIDDNSLLDVGQDLMFISDDYTRFSGGGEDSFALLIGTDSGNPSVNIGGDLVINYGPEGNKDVQSQVGIETATVSAYNEPSIQVSGDLKLISNVAESGSNDLGIILNSKASIEVDGDILLDYKASFEEEGQNILIELNNSSSVTTGALYLNSILDTSSDNNLIQVNDEAKFTIGGDLIAEKDNSSAENLIEINDEGILEIQGSIANSSESEFLFENDTKVIFNGNVAQTIPGLGANSYGILQINKTSGSITLEDDINISNSLILSNGFIENDGYTIFMAAESTIDIQNQESFVDGVLSKSFGASPSSFTFQIGNDNRVAPVKITSPEPSSTTSAEYIKGPLTSTYTSPIEEVASGHWEISTSNSQDMSFGWTDACELNIESLSGSPQTLFMVQENSSAWEQIGSTSIEAGSEACDESDTDDEEGFLTISVPTGTGYYTFGSTDVAENPLPVVLISFSLEKNNDDIIVKWKTASESNSDYFEVQKSTNGFDFETIKIVPAAGNSSEVIAYEIKDEWPFIGRSYYRLKQVDLDGSFNFFEIKSIFLTPKGLVRVYPTTLSVGDYISIETRDFSCKSLSIEMLGIDGKFIERMTLNRDAKTSRAPKTLLKAKHPGTYMLRISCGAHSTTQKLIIR